MSQVLRPPNSFENAVTTYLWLRYPDRYYIYKFGEVKKAADELGAIAEAHFAKEAKTA